MKKKQKKKLVTVFSDEPFKVVEHLFNIHVLRLLRRMAIPFRGDNFVKTSFVSLTEKGVPYSKISRN